MPQPSCLIPPILQTKSKRRHLSPSLFHDKLIARSSGMHSASFTGSTPNEVNMSIPTPNNKYYQGNSYLAAQHKLGVATINDMPLPVSFLSHI